MSISGFIFSGGSSSRFGSNKLLHEIDSVPMGICVYNNLRQALTFPPSFLGPQVSRNEFANHTFVSGSREGQGPLGAICDALEHATTEYVIFAPCDTPYFSPGSFIELAKSRFSADVVVAADETEPHMRHWLLSCWNVKSVKDQLFSSYLSGERAIHRSVSNFQIAEVKYPLSQVRNINSPQDLQ